MKKIIGIIGGKGKMGAAFTEFFEKKGHIVLVSDIETKLSNTDLATQSDIVIVSVPIPLFDSIIAEVSPFLKKETLLCDITSIKEKPLETMLQHFSGPVLGLHPMFGPSNLCVGQTVVFCSGRGEKQEQEMREILSDFSCVSLPAKNHDKAMALVQGLQHFMEISYGAALAETGFPLDSLLQVASPVYRMQMALMGRVLSQDEKMYSRIVFGSEYSQEAINSFLQCAQKIAEKKEEEFQKDFCTAREYFGDFCTRAQGETDEFIDLLAARQTGVSHMSSSELKTAEIGALGPDWTWSHLAAEHFFPEESKQLFSSFSSVFSALKAGKIEKAFLPVENTISGSVREVWEDIRSYNCSIEKIVEFPIYHALAAVKKDMDVQKIFGHAAALAQCKKTLLSVYPNAIFIPVASNSQAVMRAKSLPNSAAVSSTQAAENGGLTLIKKNIADREGNTTRFALLSGTKHRAPTKNTTHTSLFFELKNIPGSLLKGLQIFADFGVNMVRLESCPVQGENFSDYGFYVDMEGEFTLQMRQELETVAKHVVILGEYEIVKYS